MIQKGMILTGVLLLTLATCSSHRALHAQQVTLTTPLTTHGGVNFGFRYDSPTSVMFFRSGGGMPVASFGQFNPTAGNTLGLRGRRGNWSWDFGISATQGSNRYSSSTTPILTVPNGGFGFINSSIQRPFVTGIVPVVGQQAFAEQHRIALERRFTNAKSQVQEKQIAVALNEANRLAEYRESTKNKSRVRKGLDSPLVLRATPTFAGLESAPTE